MKVHNKAYWNKGMKHAAKAGRVATLTATGSAFGIVSSLGPNMGMFEVRVDGETVAIVDAYAPTRSYRDIVWTIAFDSVGLHTIAMEPLGTHDRLSGGNRVVVDAFVGISPG